MEMFNMYAKGVIVEVCAYSVQSAINAQIAGADRVELCSNMYEGELPQVMRT